MGLDWVPQMEPTMINLKVLSTAAAMALALPMAAPTASFAQNPNSGKAGVARSGAVNTGGGANFRAGGGTGFRPGGGTGFRAGGGTGFRGGDAGVRVGGGGYRGGYGGGYRRGGGGFIPGAVAGAVIGGALASQSYGYYGGPGYYAPDYYDDQYYDDGAVAVAPAPVGGDDVAYCSQTYRSYDPASGTYLGYDGLRHPCP
jgi:BA14K-like protein